MFNNTKKQLLNEIKAIKESTNNELLTLKTNTEEKLDSVNSKIDLLINKQTNQTNIEEKEELDKFKAAYALNLCMVSVSQIVDYNDLNVLEQEYNGILNNINLENFPKDEALLKIIKQILDTITFFRIEEGDKKFIEKDYQQKMKNAIWSSIPNLSMIVATGNPFVALGALASQVGIGYMNYRKEKSKITSEYEKELWELQKSAIEQFNNLERELFDTAWRLADKYKFQDNWRLTENQLKQYNDVLMDSIPERRYERLAQIKDNFEAYPIFWYQFGSTANEIANNAYENYKDGDSDLIYKKYKQLAIDHFESFDKKNDADLLRNDTIASSCYLEYVDCFLLDREFNQLNDSEKSKVKDLLNKAIAKSGQENDILQICAMDYLKINEYEKACKLLRLLVTEDYNKIINAQILSQMYLQQALSENSLRLRADYLTLSKFVNKFYLYPFPEVLPKSEEDKNKLIQGYLSAQKYVLMQKAALILGNIINKYTIQLNKKLQNPNYNNNYDDSFFSDSENERAVRHNELKQIIKTSRRGLYIDNLAQYIIGDEYINTLNSFVLTLEQLDIINDDYRSYISSKLNDYDVKNTFKLLDEKNCGINSCPLEESDLNKFFKISLSYLIEDYIKAISERVYKHILSLESLSEINNFESQLRNLCLSQELKEPEYIFDYKDVDEDKSQKELPFSTEKYLSANIQEQKLLKERTSKQIDIIKKFTGNMSTNIKRMTLMINDSTCDDYFKYIDASKNKIDSYIKRNLIAVFAGKHWTKKDLYFTADRIFFKDKRGYDESAYYSDLLKQGYLYKDIMDNNPLIIEYVFKDLLSELAQNSVKSYNIYNSYNNYNSVNDMTEDFPSLYKILPKSIANKIGTQLMQEIPENY